MAPVLPASPSSDSAQAPSYIDEPAVIQHMDWVYQMAADGTGWRQITVAVRAQSEASVKQLGVVTIAYAANSEHVEIAYARVRHPDGTVIETPVTDAMDMADPVTREAPFYSDLKEKQLPIRSLRASDTLEWQARIIRTKAEAPGQFWGQQTFSQDVVTLAESLELRVPKDVNINIWSPTSKPQETTDNGERIFRWTSSQKKPTVGKQAGAERERQKKQVWTAAQELDATQGKLPSVAWTTFKNWEAVGAWYRGLEADRAQPSPEIKAKVAELTAGKSTEEEKVRAVYAYVATQIRYIGVAFGVGRYQPHSADEVLQNQYGDCKDKHTLLAAMLGALGLHPDAVLIGAGIRFNPAVPSPAAFNHLITLVSVNGQPVWLDATAEVAPYRMIMYVLRDRSVLVVPDTGVARIDRTPANLPFAPFQTMDAVGTLDKDGISNSHLSLTLRGDDELAVRSALRQLSPAQYDQVVQQMSQGLGYGGTTSHAEISRLNDTAVPLKISYDYKREKGGDWANYRIIPQIAPVLLPRPDDKDPPVRAISLGVPRVETSTSAMKLPDGWGVELPEAIHAKSFYATYDETYRFEKGTLYAQRRIEVLQEKVPVADWKTYKKWADTVDLGNEQYVQLTHTGDKPASAGSPSKESPATVSSNAEAATLIASAYKALQQHDLAGGKLMLDQAKNLNDKQVWLWTSYGMLAFQQGEPSIAIEDYKKELSLHPDQYGAYPRLSYTEDLLGQRKEAKETLKQWAAVDQNNPEPASRLIDMLLKDNDSAGAVSTAEAAIARLPADKKNDETLHLQLGRAQLKAGMKQQGSATLLALVQTTHDPEMMNNSAYELADAGEGLPQAETALQAALAKLDEESNGWTLDESPQLLGGKTHLIVAMWDTMGWIFFREGKLDEAASYLKSAWKNAHDTAGGEHLGDLLTAQGNRDAALTAYELALATISPYDRMGIRQAPGPEEIKLKAHIAALRRSGAKSSIRDPHTALQQLRTVSLGPAKGLDGTAEYLLLLSQGTVQRIKPMGEKQLPGGDARIKALHVSDFWPSLSHANLVRSGMLNCHSGTCEFIFVP